MAFFADLYKMSDEQVLRQLQDAGLDSLPGGGAEIFAERVRRKICHDKCGADRYLEIHRTAHALGMRTNVTMLYGHIEPTRSVWITCSAHARYRTRVADFRHSFLLRSIPTITRCASYRRRVLLTRCECMPCRD
jgi:2-iminoacetate synthase ThiH